MQGLLAELERMSQPAETKAEIKRRLAGLKVAVYTTPKSWTRRSRSTKGRR